MGTGVGGISVVAWGCVGVGLGGRPVLVGCPGVADGMSVGDGVDIVGSRVPVIVGIMVTLPVIVGVKVMVGDEIVAVGGEHSSATASIVFDSFSSARIE